jgi:hypothetical protein
MFNKNWKSQIFIKIVFKYFGALQASNLPKTRVNNAKRVGVVFIELKRLVKDC